MNHSEREYRFTTSVLVLAVIIGGLIFILVILTRETRTRFAQLKQDIEHIATSATAIITRIDTPFGQIEQDIEATSATANIAMINTVILHNRLRAVEKAAIDGMERDSAQDRLFFQLEKQIEALRWLRTDLPTTEPVVYIIEGDAPTTELLER